MSSVLTTQQFLERVLPDAGPYCVAYPVIRKDGQKAYAHVACKTITDAVAAAKRICFTQAKDAYFAVHGLIKGAIWDQDKQRLRVSRTHDNMREGRCFFFDLDVGDGDKKHKSREEALVALERFVFRTGLPYPLVVSSGGGYHVYWLLERAIPSAEWRAYADRMRWLAATNGLKADPARITDQASVLRVVGTKNFKPDVQAKVVALTEGDITDTDEFIAKLTAKTENFTPLTNLINKSRPTQVGNLGTLFDGRCTPVQEVYDACAQMREVRDRMGMVIEPMWKAFIEVMMWTEDGEDEVHEVSKGDPRYDAAETQAKIEHGRKFSTMGCGKIEHDSGNDLCQSCPFHGLKHGKNPLDIANKEWAKKVQPSAQPTPVQLQQGVTPIKAPCLPPHPYTLGNGGVCISKLDPAQQAVVEKILLPYHLFPIAKFRGSRSEPGYSTWCVTLPLEGQVTFRIDDEAFHDLRQFAGQMMNAGVIIANANVVTEVKAYMLHYLHTLQKQIVAGKLYDHYGWDYADDGKPTSKQAFVLDKRAFDIKKNEWTPVSMSASMKGADAWMGQDGTLDAYLDAMKFYNRPQWRHIQFFYLCGMISPWFYATGEHGVVISANGPPGASKSSALMAVGAMWGNPDIGQYVISGAQGKSTMLGRQERFQMLPNHPICLDEITLQANEAIAQLAIEASQPGGRIRLDSKSHMRDMRGGVSNHTILVSTNTSMVAAINAVNMSGQAALARVIEILFPKGKTADKTEADKFVRKLRANYGHAGPALLEALLPDTKDIEKEIHAASDALNAELQLQPSERFFGFTVACVMVIGRRAAKLGLHPFDMDAVKAWIVEVQLPFQREHSSNQAERSSPTELLSGYLMKFQGEMIRVDIDAAGNLAGTVSAPLSREVAYRYDIHRKEIWIRCEHFRDHCTKLSLDPAIITSALLKNKVFKYKGRKALFEGMPQHPHELRNFCYIVDLKHPKIAGTVAQATSQP